MIYDALWRYMLLSNHCTLRPALCPLFKTQHAQQQWRCYINNIVSVVVALLPPLVLFSQLSMRFLFRSNQSEFLNLDKYLCCYHAAAALDQLLLIIVPHLFGCILINLISGYSCTSNVWLLCGIGLTSWLRFSEVYSWSVRDTLRFSVEISCISLSKMFFKRRTTLVSVSSSLSMLHWAIVFSSSPVEEKHSKINTKL